MKTKTCAESAPGGLADLADAALAHLKTLGYRPDTLGHYRGTWRNFTRFAEARGQTELSVDLTEAFLASRGVPSIDSGESPSSQQRHLRMAMRVLLEFQAHGCFQRRRSVAGRVPLPEWSVAAVDGFERFCTEHLGTSARTMRVRRRDLTRFLLFLDAHGITDLSEITPSHLGDFMHSRAHLRPRTLALVASHLRSFLRYLAMEGVVDASLVTRVPKVRVRQDESIPDVWTAEEVDALLGAVDRASPVGKRDFAILLLAARLGMRAGDIRDLRLEELRWDECCIARPQSKTGAPLVLPLTHEVGEAIIDYLRNGRPESPHREVFLRANAPFQPFGRDNNLYSIVSTYRRRAGISLPRRSRKGLHSLRHTVATRLLEADTPLPVISAVMGHLSSESTRIYAKVDIAALRQVALDPEEVAHA